MSASASRVMPGATHSLGATTATEPARGSPRWLLYYYVAQFVCQLALLSDALAPARFVFRSAVFGMSLAALALTAARTGGIRHPAAPWALLSLVIVTLQSLHPETGSGVLALATIGMYVAILGPLFWVRRLNLTEKSFRTVIITVWAFQSISALFGALQVYYPGVFQPAISTILSDNYVSSLQIQLANGERILRPSGLTDTPGGAAIAGAYAILLGLGLWSTRPSKLLRLLIVTSFGIGMFVLYLCQIRSLVVMVAISTMASAGVHASRGRIRASIGTVGAIGAIALVSFLLAASVGGDDMVRRFATLTTSSPTDVYYTNRGIFLEHTLTDLLPQYPLGAGLGRWGSFVGYFGASASSPIYVEVQWTGWLLDGGIPLVVAYSLMLWVTLRQTWLFTMDRSKSELAAWAAVLLGYDIGAVALTFNYPLFISALGLDFWLLNTALFVVMRNASGRPERGPVLSSVSTTPNAAH